MTKNEFLKVKLNELEDEKELINKLILQTEEMLKLFPMSSDYLKGKIDAFKLLGSYVDDRIKDLDFIY